MIATSFRRVVLSNCCVLTISMMAQPVLAEQKPVPSIPQRADQKPAASIEAKYLKNIRQVTSGMTKAGEGYFSPDGKQIIYQAIPAGYPFYQIYTQPLAGGRPRRISTGRGRTTCSYFSPDGKRILFASSHLDPNIDTTESDARKQQEEDRKSGRRRRYSWNFDPHMDIFEADLKGKILRRLTKTKGYDAEGAYSKDGKLIAFSSDRDGDPDLFIMNSDGTGERRLNNAPGYDGGPFISPDQKWVVFRSDRKKKEHLQIYVIGIDGKHETPLTDNNGVNWAPFWHPTKPYIIWAGADHSNLDKKGARPNYDLWLIKYAVVDGEFYRSAKHRITDSPAADVLPVFSPDGKKLMWTSTRTKERASQLFIADFEFEE
jgi:Tol biopolymer transport system component